MAITKVSNSGFKSGMTKYDSFLAGNEAYDPAATWLIQRVAGTGSSGSITFSSIPQTYQHIQIRALANTNAGANAYLMLQVNGDTGSNYANHGLYGDGSSAFAYGNASDTKITQNLIFNSSTSHGVQIIDIHDYANTSKYKTTRTMSGDDLNGSGRIYLTSGLWMSTSAVTSITLYSTSGSFTTSSTFALYGFTG